MVPMRFGEFDGRLVQVACRFIIRLQQCFDPPPQFEVITAFAVEDCGTIGLFDGGQKDGLHALGIDWHGLAPMGSTHQCDETEASCRKNYPPSASRSQARA